MRITSFSQIYHSKPVQYAAIATLAIYLFINLRAYWRNCHNCSLPLKFPNLRKPTYKAFTFTLRGSDVLEKLPDPIPIAPNTPLGIQAESDRKFAEDTRIWIQNKLGKQNLINLVKLMTPQIIKIRMQLTQESAFELSDEQKIQDVAEQLIKENETLREAVQQASANLMNAAKAKGMALFGGSGVFVRGASQTPMPVKRTSVITYEPRSVQTSIVRSILKRRSELDDSSALTERILIDALTPIRNQMRPVESDEEEPWSGD